MANHHAAIGFHITDQDDLVDLAFAAVNGGEAFESKNGIYVRWDAGNGAEIWAQLDEENKISAINPHFSGKCIVPMGLTRHVELAEGSKMDGGFYAWVAPSSEDFDASGKYPLVFDCPNFDLLIDEPLPALANVQLSAFAHQMSAYADARAFDKAQAAEEIQHDQKSFLATGLFDENYEELDPPLPMALIVGIVKQARRLENPFGGGYYHHVVLETLHMDIDIVAAVGSSDGIPRSGGIVKGTFYLSGRINL